MLSRLAHAVARERAVIIGTAITLLTAIENGTFTWESAAPLVAGVVIRFFVTPANEAAEGVYDGYVAGAEEGYEKGAEAGMTALLLHLSEFSDEE